MTDDIKNESVLPTRPKPYQARWSSDAINPGYGYWRVSADAYMDAQDARIATLEAENQRLLDLVRYQRHELLDAKLISMDEFTALVQDSDSGLRVARLETYDQIRAQLAQALKDKAA